MSEHTLQNRLKRLGILAAVVSAIILVSGSLASRYLRNILKEALTEQMKSDADPASFVRNFQESPASAHFESIEYLSGPELEPGAVNENVSRLLEEVRDGKSGVSRIYREGETGESRFAYAVPVYLDRMPVGAVIAYSDTDVFLDILEAENTDEMNTKILRLKELGFRISMDDFGSGYSSLNALAGLKIDELKFDRGFLSGLKGADADRGRQIVIMREVVDLAKKLGLKTVMEGIETKNWRVHSDVNADRDIITAGRSG